MKWDVKNKEGNEKVDISFQLLNKMNNEVRGVNDQIRAVIVDGNLKNIQQTKPIFAGNGSYKLSSDVAKVKSTRYFCMKMKTSPWNHFLSKILVKKKGEKQGQE